MIEAVIDTPFSKFKPGEIMIYLAEPKMAFGMPLRTGSTTFATLLKEWGAAEFPNPSRKHAYLCDVIKSMPEIVDYKLYGFMRNPLDRYLSIIRYMQKSEIAHFFAHELGISIQEFYSLTPNSLHTLLAPNLDKINTKITAFFAPQTAWLKDAELLDFENYELEILKIARFLGKTHVTIPHLNATNNKEPATDEVKDFVQSYYADDCTLWKERFGREIA